MFASKPPFNFFLSPFLDVNKKRSSYGESLYELDGLRGLAVLIVVASHTAAFRMYGQGSLGVLLFFFLSGFVLTLPFVNISWHELNLHSFMHYGKNRILRIVPIYWICVLFIAYILGENESWIFYNFTFMKGWNHLWSVAQEVRFYLLFPLIIIILSLLNKIEFKIILIIIISYLFYHYRSYHTVDLMDGRKVFFYFWMFLGGSLACHLSKLHFLKHFFKKPLPIAFLNFLSLLIFLFIFFSSTDMIKYFWNPLFPQIDQNTVLNGWRIPHIWYFLFLLLLFSITITRFNLIGMILRSYLLRHIGLLSYSIYLFHMPLIMKTRHLKLSPETDFFFILFLSYIIAFFSYIFIEKPFLSLKNKSFFTIN